MAEQIKILCVDDEQNVLRALQRLFLDGDYEIITAGSGDEGLAILGEDETIPLVISDYRMPGMNGVDFLRKVCELRPDTVRIVLSGYADTASIVEAINEGQIYKFVPKPWNDDELKVTISTALDHYFARQKIVHLARELEKKNRQLETINENLEKLVQERTADLQMKNRILTAAQNILDSMPLGVVGIEPGGMIVQCNRKAAEIFGSDEGAFIGMDRRESFPEVVNAFIDRINGEGMIRESIGNGDGSGRINMRGVYMKYQGGQEGIIVVMEQEGSG
jgi:two-component system NtrC family sensor kinase